MLGMSGRRLLQLLRLAGYASSTRFSATHKAATELLPPVQACSASSTQRSARTECMTLGVRKRCSGIDSRSEGMVGVLGAMVERGERAAHAR